MEKINQARKLDVYDTVLCALFSALIAAGAFVKIPGPLVVFTLQTFFASAAVFILGKRLGTISAAVYVLTGLCGFPVFTQGGGPQYVLQPTFGYLIGFVISGWVCGSIIENVFRGRNRIAAYIAAPLSYLAVLYTCGVVHYCLVTSLFLGNPIQDLAAVIAGCALVFIPTDLLSIALAAVTAKRVRPALARLKAGNAAKRGGGTTE